MTDPRGFLKYHRARPDARPPSERVQDFREFYARPASPDLQIQGARCMDCGVPFCQGPTGCPTENLIPEWNDLVSRGHWQQALASLHSTNNFPEFTGRLCPAPCESACVLGIGSDPVTIRSVEWELADRGFDEGWIKPLQAASSTGLRVAVIGSGPAGLSAAQELARRGHSVSVYEKADRIGGLLRYGIPDFKMEKSVLDRRLRQLEAEGVEFITGVEVGKTLSVEELRKGFAAICVTIGAEQPRDVKVPGRELPGVHWAMDFLAQQNRRVAGLPSTELSAKGKNVVILGGGDTGSDCLGTALRQGALKVTQFELLPKPPKERDPSTPWPLWPLKLRTSHAHEEGGLRDWAVSTLEFLGHSQLSGLRLARINWTGKSFEVLPGTEFHLSADLVLLATGFSGPLHEGLLQELQLTLDPGGRIHTTEDFQTSQPGIFAAGDSRRGASLIVWAIAEGRKMAHSVDRYLAGRPALAY